MSSEVFERFEQIRFDRWFDSEFPLARETVEDSKVFKFMFDSWLACAKLRLDESTQKGTES